MGTQACIVVPNRNLCKLGIYSQESSTKEEYDDIHIHAVTYDVYAIALRVVTEHSVTHTFVSIVSSPQGYMLNPTFPFPKA